MNVDRSDFYISLGTVVDLLNTDMQLVKITKLSKYILEFSFLHKHSNRNVATVKALLEITRMNAGSQRVKNNISQRDSMQYFVVPVTAFRHYKTFLFTTTVSFYRQRVVDIVNFI